MDDLLPLAVGERPMDLSEVLWKACLRDDRVAGVAVEEAVASIRMVLDWGCQCSRNGSSRHDLYILVDVML